MENNSHWQSLCHSATTVWANCATELCPDFISEFKKINKKKLMGTECEFSFRCHSGRNLPCVWSRGPSLRVGTLTDTDEHEEN